MEQIGDYEYSKKDLIGHGAFAVVFKGRIKKKPESPVAIKCITKKNLAKSQSLLSKEIKILKELSDLHHENVVALLECKETSHHVFLVMEYCNGGDLADYLQAKGTLSEDTIALFLRQIAAAMKALFEKGIVHRDMKPQNILLCHPPKTHSAPGNMRLKIADFGFARFLQDGVMAATLCGSPMYMAPEVIMSIQYDAKADLWSIGTIVYQCLTGKAPFQAQTPQQLKQFYERNANLAPNIPSGTSPELRNLLNALLKRNAKDRLEFDDFFRHPFHHREPAKTSSPVPVPRTRSRSSVSESPPTMKPVNASPLSGNMPVSPPHPAVQRVREQSEPMDQSPSPQEGATAPRVARDERAPMPRCSSPVEDYVMVPENIPSDHSAGSAGSKHHPSSVDLNAIFSDNSPESPKVVPRSNHTSRSSSPAFKKAAAAESPQTSPSRPSTLSVQSPASSPSSQPIPVPSQVAAYEQMQRSGSSPHAAASSPALYRGSGSSPHLHKVSTTPSRLEQIGEERGVPIPTRKISGTSDIGSISPPSVQFTIGTPPNSKWRRSSVSGTTPPSNSSSPHRKTPGQASPRVSTTPTLSNPASLPTIIGSPTKAPTTGFSFPTTATTNDTTQLSPADIRSPTSAPLSAPFGTTRLRTCPDNVVAVGFSPTSPEIRRHSTVVPVRCATSPGNLIPHSPSGSSRLSEQLLRAAFGTSPNTPGGFPAHSPPSGAILPYTGSNVPAAREPSPGGRERTMSSGSSSEQLQHKAPHVSNENNSPTEFPGYFHSSPTMEGPISFVAPELAEEILMDRDHNDTVAKLNFVLALVECIIELAHSRSSPISESIIDQRQGNTFRLDHTGFVSDSQRQMEQLVLYVRALQLLASSIELAKDQTKAGHLKASQGVKLIVRELTNYYHQCLGLCRQLHARGVGQHPGVQPQAAAVTAHRLIYTYAIEMCQTAALDELFGNPQECFRRYRSAQILLHSLSQQAQDPNDRYLLNKYKESVEKRLYNLSSHGYVQAYDTS